MGEVVFKLGRFISEVLGFGSSAASTAEMPAGDEKVSSLGAESFFGQVGDGCVKAGAVGE